MFWYPENFFTVWYNLFERGQIKNRDTILIHGGSSGIGTAAIQLCKVHGCNVITTVGNRKKQLFCKKLVSYHVRHDQTIL